MDYKENWCKNIYDGREKHTGQKRVAKWNVFLFCVQCFIIYYNFFADFTIVVSVVVITIIIIICENGNAHQKGKTTKLVSQPLLIYVYMYIFNTIMHKQL